MIHFAFFVVSACQIMDGSGEIACSTIEELESEQRIPGSSVPAKKLREIESSLSCEKGRQPKLHPISTTAPGGFGLGWDFTDIELSCQDEQGRKSGPAIFYHHSALAHDCHPHIVRGQYVDDKKEGRWFSEEGLENNYKNGQLHGFSKDPLAGCGPASDGYTASGWYEDGKKCGTWQPTTNETRPPCKEFKEDNREQESTDLKTQDLNSLFEQTESEGFRRVYSSGASRSDPRLQNHWISVFQTETKIRVYLYTLQPFKSGERQRGALSDFFEISDAASLRPNPICWSIQDKNLTVIGFQGGDLGLEHPTVCDRCSKGIRHALSIDSETFKIKRMDPSEIQCTCERLDEEECYDQGQE